MMLMDTGVYVDYPALELALYDVGVGNLELAAIAFAEEAVLNYVTGISKGVGFITYPKMNRTVSMKAVCDLGYAPRRHYHHLASSMNDNWTNMFNLPAINYAMHRLGIVGERFDIRKVGAIPSGILRIDLKEPTNGTIQDYRHGVAG